MSSDARKIKDRIRRLREMTSARGCTEAEALAAAEKAAQLMRDHGLSDAEIRMEDARSKSPGGQSAKAALWPSIAFCTNTSHVIVWSMRGTEVEFIGLAPGPDIAIYLRQVCERAVDRAVREFKKSRFYRARRGLSSKRAAVADFTIAMINRLNHRLVQTFAPARNPNAQAEAKQALVERYPDLVEVKQKEAPLRHIGAQVAGWAAGEDVTLAHGIGGSESKLQIGFAE